MNLRTMSSDMVGEEKYIELMREKTGEERLMIASQLREFVLKLSQLGIRSQFPKISKKELREKLLQRIYGDNLSFKISRRQAG